MKCRHGESVQNEKEKENDTENVNERDRARACSERVPTRMDHNVACQRWLRYGERTPPLHAQHPNEI
jgi:hypothetical protein